MISLHKLNAEFKKEINCWFCASLLYLYFNIEANYKVIGNKNMLDENIYIINQKISRVSNTKFCYY